MTTPSNETEYDDDDEMLYMLTVHVPRCSLAKKKTTLTAKTPR